MNWNLRNILIVFWLASVVFFIIAKGIIPGYEEGRSDFSNYYSSAVLLVNGESISKFYDNDWFSVKAKEIGEKQGAKFAPFPPATAFLYLPLIAFNPVQAKRIWLVFNVLLLFVLVFQLKRFSELPWVEILLILSLFCIPITSNFRLGQSYLLFTNFIVLFLSGIKKGKYFLGSGFLGVATAIKYFPVIYLISVFPKMKKKIIIGFVSGTGIIALLPIITDGFSSYQAFVFEFWNHLNGDLSGQGMYSFTFQSIDVLLANLFVYHSESNPHVLLDLPILKGIVKLAFSISILYFIYKSFKSQIEKTREINIAITVVGASLLIPASATYHLLLLIPALVLLFSWLAKMKRPKQEVLLVSFLVFISCSLLVHHIPQIASFPNLNVILHFPRLFALLALFFSLIVIQKRYLQDNG